VLDQHAELDFHSASSLKQQSADKHAATLGHIILIPSEPVCALSLCCMLSGEATNTNFIVWFDLIGARAHIENNYFYYIKFSTHKAFLGNKISSAHSAKIRKPNNLKDFGGK